MLYQDEDPQEHEAEYDRLCNTLTGKGADAYAVKLHASQQQLSGASKLSHVYAVSKLAARYADYFYTESDFNEQRYRKLTCKFAGLLHEAIESGGQFEEVCDVSDETSARMVSMLTPDRRMPRPKRLKLYINQVGLAGEAVQLVKLADLQHECFQMLTVPNRSLKDKVLLQVEEWREEAIELLAAMSKIQESIYLAPQVAILKANLTKLGQKCRNRKVRRN
jgi:(p)ppGpp synthase/HD superfamily hydrolase